MKKNNRVIYDPVTNVTISMRNNDSEMYLIKDGKKMRLDALVLKQSRERN